MFFVTALFQANEPLTDTFILDLVAHNRRPSHGINMSMPKRLKPFKRQRVLLQDANNPSHATQVIGRAKQTRGTTEIVYRKVPTITKPRPFVRAVSTKVEVHHLVELEAGEMSKRTRSRKRDCCPGSTLLAFLRQGFQKPLKEKRLVDAVKPLYDIIGPRSTSQRSTVLGWRR